MNLEQLQSFRAVAEVGGFKRAADARFLAQSTISMQVAALERELGVRLFDRLGWRVILTDAGKEFLKHSVRILALVEDSRRAIDDIRGLGSGTLTVGATYTIGNHVAPKLLGQFNAKYPGVRLVLQIGNATCTADKVIEGAVDLGLVEVPVSSPDLIARPFMIDHFVLIVPREHRWVEQGEIDGFELSRERFIAREPQSVGRRVVEDQLRAVGVEVHPVLELGTPTAMLGAVSAGLGVTIISRQVAALALAAGVVAEVKIRGASLQRVLNVVLHREKHLSPVLSAFLTIVDQGA